MKRNTSITNASLAARQWLADLAAVLRLAAMEVMAVGIVYTNDPAMLLQPVGSEPGEYLR